VALELHGKVVAQSGQPNHLTVIHCSQELALIILAKILLILDENSGFEMDVRSSSAYLDFFVAFFNRGPKGLGRYFYFYGLLDCISQLCS